MIAAGLLGALGRLFGRRGSKSEPLPEIEDALDGASAVAIAEACVADAAGLDIGQPLAASARAFGAAIAGGEGNLLGGAVGQLDLAEAREAIAGASGMALAGMRAAAFVDGPGIAGAHDQLAQASQAHLPLVVHLRARSLGGPGSTLGSGHEAYHAVADAGCVQLFACNVQDALDLTLVAHRLAEAALVPVVVAIDAEQTASSLQNVRLPSRELVQRYLGAPGEQIECPTPAQRQIFGANRARVPRWIDLERPAMVGAQHGRWSRGAGASGQRPFFLDHVPELLEQALAELEALVGRRPDPVLRDQLDGAQLLLVAQGAAVETARSVAAHLRTERRLEVGVLGVRCLRPFPGSVIAEHARGRAAVVVLERLDAPLAGESPLLREVRGAVGQALENGRFGEQHAGYPRYAPREQPRLLSAAYGLGGHPLRAADLAKLCLEATERRGPLLLGVDFAGSASAYPKRQAALETLRRSYPRLEALALRAPGPNLRREGTWAVAVHRIAGQGSSGLADAAASLLSRALDGCQVRGRRDEGWQQCDEPCRDHFICSTRGLWDPGDEVVADISLVVTPQLGRFVGGGVVDAIVDGGALVVESALDDATLWAAMPAAWREPIRRRKLALYRAPADTADDAEAREERQLGALLAVMQQQVDSGLPLRRALAVRTTVLEEALGEEKRETIERLLAAFRGGFEGVARVAESPAAGAEQPPATEVEPPAIVRRLLPQGNDAATAFDSLPRFWSEVGVLYRDGQSEAPGSDPYMAAGMVPPLSAAMRDLSASSAMLPAFDPALCSGCGRCWSVCPDSAIAPLAIATKDLLEAGIDLAKARGAAAEPLRALLSKLGPWIAGALKKADPVPTSVEAAMQQPFAELLDKAGFPTVRRSAIELAFEAVLSEIGAMPVARTEPLFFGGERQTPGGGELLTLAINPDACKGCGACIPVCEPQALVAQPSEAARIDQARAQFKLWDSLPDTRGSTIARVRQDPEVGELAALLLSRHCGLALAWGDGAEPGSGAKIALRSCLAVGEYALQEQLAGLVERVESLRQELAQHTRDNLAKALPTGDIAALADGLDSLGRGSVRISELTAKLEGVLDGRQSTRTQVDVVRLQRLVAVAQQLADLHWRLTRGPQGLGRARLSLVLSPGELERGIAAFPHNPFAVPTAVYSGRGEVAAFARGLLEGQLRAAIDGIRAMRLARLELDNPTEASLSRERLQRLTFDELTAEERASCPPLLLVAPAAALRGRNLTELLRPGWPLKLLLLADNEAELGGAVPEIALLAQGAREVYVGQASVAYPQQLGKALLGALRYPGPAVIQVYAPSPARHGIASDAAVAHAKLAVDTRVFPLFMLDPTLEGVFGVRLSLAGNPAPDADWAKDEDDAPLMPAQWVAAATQLAQRFGDGNGALEALTARRAGAWRVLQELAGEVTPFTAAVRADAEENLAASHERELADLRRDYEDRIQKLRQEHGAEIAARIQQRLMALAGYGADERRGVHR